MAFFHHRMDKEARKARERRYEAIVMGASAGGLAALTEIFSVVGNRFSLPILVVQHISPGSRSYLPGHFTMRSPLGFKEAEDKEVLAPGTVYFAPPNYHLMVEIDKSLALSTTERVHFSRPSVDVLFETAAEAFGDRLVGVILTGGNSDGAAGLAKIKQYGGLTLVQAPETAAADAMPRAALGTSAVDHVLPLDRIGKFLQSLEK